MKTKNLLHSLWSSRILALIVSCHARQYSSLQSLSVSLYPLSSCWRVSLCTQICNYTDHWDGCGDHACHLCRLYGRNHWNGETLHPLHTPHIVGINPTQDLITRQSCGCVCILASVQLIQNKIPTPSRHVYQRQHVLINHVLNGVYLLHDVFSLVSAQKRSPQYGVVWFVCLQSDPHAFDCNFHFSKIHVVNQKRMTLSPQNPSQLISLMCNTCGSTHTISKPFATYSWCAHGLNSQ